MQIPGINPALLRLMATGGQELATDLLTSGRVLKADVVSVFQDRAVLAFGRGARLEAQTQVPLREGQQITVQVQPSPAGQQPGAMAPLVLRLVHDQAPGREPASTGQTNAGAGQPAAGSPGQATAQNLGREAVILRGDPTVPLAPTVQPPGAPAGAQAPALFWLPIPLPDGGQGWAQIHVPPEAPRRGQGQREPAPRQIRIWWETPALGPVQVVLDGTASEVSALFTAASAESRSQIESGLPDLQQRLAGAGFPESRLGCRQSRPGEAPEPDRPEGTPRLDARF